MFLSTLSLSNFRNYKKSEFKFTKQITLFVGPNTSGKTNLLEATYLLSHGKSFRAESDRECIKWGEEIGRVEAEIISENSENSENQMVRKSEDQRIRESEKSEKIQLEITLTIGQIGEQKAPLKKYLINGVVKRQIDFISNLKSVLFRPEDLELITDSPGTRRDYLDRVLVQTDREYRRSLLSYQKGLRQRNKLLDFIREGKAQRHQLYFWDKLLIKNGNLLTSRRQELVDFLNNHIDTSTGLSVNPERSRGVDIFADLEIEYDLSAISVERLEKYKEEEVAAGATLVGPHRDDFIIYQRKDKTLRNVHHFGSRGEQRLAVLSLKLCELDFIEKNTGERPILLLDDIFSELDTKHRELVISAIPRQQTIITTTDIHFVEDFLEKMEVIKLFTS